MKSTSLKFPKAAGTLMCTNSPKAGPLSRRSWERVWRAWPFSWGREQDQFRPGEGIPGEEQDRCDGIMTGLRNPLSEKVLRGDEVAGVGGGESTPCWPPASQGPIPATDLHGPGLSLGLPL